MREILTIPNATLRKKCKSVKAIDSEIKALADEMDELMGIRHHGLVPVGIAAPQIGQLIRMFVYRLNPYSEESSTVVLINPEPVYAKMSVILGESCLSIPGKQFYVKRHKIVKVKAMNINGEYHSYRGRGVIAQIFEHELDHLDGVLIDKTGEERR